MPTTLLDPLAVAVDATVAEPVAAAVAAPSDVATEPALAGSARAVA